MNLLLIIWYIYINFRWRRHILMINIILIIIFFFCLFLYFDTIINIINKWKFIINLTSIIFLFIIIILITKTYSFISLPIHPLNLNMLIQSFQKLSFPSLKLYSKPRQYLLNFIKIDFLIIKFNLQQFLEMTIHPFLNKMYNLFYQQILMYLLMIFLIQCPILTNPHLHLPFFINPNRICIRIITFIIRHQYLIRM